MLAATVFNQNNGDVTKRYYAELGRMGYLGLLAVALFRAQKRSTAAKRYRGRGYKEAAYDVKNWSLGQVCLVLQSRDFDIEWGWRRDEKAVNFEWVLYVNLPNGQCSFHSPTRGEGPDFKGKWSPTRPSEQVILEFCDSVWNPSPQTAAKES